MGASDRAWDGSGAVVVVDDCSAESTIRWNLLGRPTVTEAAEHLDVVGGSWAARLVPGAGAGALDRSRDDPTSGWHSPTYGAHEPLAAVLLTVPEGHRAVSCFVQQPRSADLDVIADRAERLDVGRLTVSRISEVLRAR